MYQQKHYLHQNSRNPNSRAHNLKYTTSTNSSSIVTDHALAFVVLICLPLFAAYWTRRVRRQRQHGQHITSSFFNTSSASGFIALILTHLVKILRQRNNEGSVRLEEDCEQWGVIDRKNGAKGFKDAETPRSSRCEMEQLGMTGIHPSTASHLPPVSDSDNEPLIELHVPTLHAVNSSPPQSSTSPDHVPASSSETPSTPPPPQAPTLSSRNSGLTVSPDLLARIQEVVKRRDEARMSNEGLTEVECINGDSFTRVKGKTKSAESKNPWRVGEVERLNGNSSTQAAIQLPRASQSPNTPSHIHHHEITEQRVEMSLERDAEDSASPQLLATGESVIASSTSSTLHSHSRWSIDKSSIVLERSLRSVRKSKIKRAVDIDEEHVRMDGGLVNAGSMLVKGVRDRGDWDEEQLEL